MRRDSYEVLPTPRCARGFAWLALLANIGALGFNAWRRDYTEAAISLCGITICTFNFWVLKWAPRLIKR